MSGFHLTRRGALGLAVAAGFATLLKPLRARGVDTVAVRRGYAKGRFGQLHYRIAKPETAPAPPLLCLHSSPNSGRIYETFLGAMGTDRVALAADTPGFGDSDPPPEAPSIEDYAAAMGDLIDTMGFETVDVIGYHTGAMTSVELALQRPEQVRRVIMISAPVYTDQELKQARDRYGAVLGHARVVIGSRRHPVPRRAAAASHLLVGALRRFRLPVGRQAAPGAPARAGTESGR
jgi:pimeloyl-ACP methyl ester carboxylesterase